MHRTRTYVRISETGFAMHTWSVGKLIGLALVIGIGVGLYYLGRGFEHQSTNAVVPVLGIPDRAAATVAEANLQTASAAAATYYNEHGSYAGMSSASLLAMSPGLPATIQVKRADATSFCLEDDLRDQVAHMSGPGGTAAAGPC